METRKNWGKKQGSYKPPTKVTFDDMLFFFLDEKNDPRKGGDKANTYLSQEMLQNIILKTEDRRAGRGYFTRRGTYED